MNIIKFFLTLIITHQMLTSSLLFAVENTELSLQEIALPSEVKDLGKQAGSVYYNTSVKNKVLVPTHFWGEIGRPGLHFIPADTTLIKGLSMAGGPSSNAKMENVVLTRTNPDGSLKQFDFNLSDGGDAKAYQFKMESGDSVFIKKDSFREDRTYYTGLIGIAISIISTIVVLSNVKK